eukprot:COSAG01_NODE_771_length_13718_cov_54.441442_6_plen_493_part_00
MFQLGILAVSQRIDQVQIRPGELSGSNMSLSGAISSPGLGGIDSYGQPFNRSFSVDHNRVGVLWIAIDINSSAVPGEYRGSITLSAHSSACDSVGRCASGSSVPTQTTIRIALTIGHTQPVVDGGDFEPIETLARTRWLDSTAGVSKEPAARFQPLTRSADGMGVSSSTANIRLDNTGLPASVSQKGHPHTNLLHEPVSFVAVDQHNIHHQFRSNASSVVWSNASTADVAVWHAQAHIDILSLTLHLRAALHAHGELDFSVNVSNVGTKPVELRDLLLVLPFRESRVPYAMGLGKTGGRRPPQWAWRWVFGQGHDQGNHMLWMGDPFLGMRLKLKGDDPSWNSGLKIVKLDDVPASWGGHVDNVQCVCAHEHCLEFSKCNLTTMRGGVNISSAKDNVVTVRSFTGARVLATQSVVTFNFDMLVTPGNKFSPRVRFSQRYTQQGGAMPLDKLNMERLIDQLVQSGAVTVNIHQGSNINPYIDYVTVGTRLSFE